MVNKGIIEIKARGLKLFFLKGVFVLRAPWPERQKHLERKKVWPRDFIS
jgi:hypothetical protein